MAINTLYIQVVTARIIEDLFENRAGTLENRVEFSSPVTLGLLRTLLIIICEELAQYDTWPVRKLWFIRNSWL